VPPPHPKTTSLSVSEQVLLERTSIIPSLS
jgi:hypothetical protein